MLNYVMEYLLLFLLGLAVFRAAGSPNPISPQVVNNAMLPHLAGREPAHQCRLPRRPGGSGRGGMAVEQDHARLRAAHGRGQPERRPGRRDEPGDGPG